MIREPLPNEYENKFFNRKDIVFQIIDWKSNDIYYKKEEERKNEKTEESYDEDEDDEDEEPKKKNYGEKKLVIRGYGVTENGNSICVHIENFKPRFFFKIPNNWTNQKFNQFKSIVMDKVEPFQKDGLFEAGIVKKKEFYGFTNNEYFLFGVFAFKNQSSYYAYLRVMREKKIFFRYTNEEYFFGDKLYETKVSSLLRFFHVRNLDPSGWMKVNANKYKRNIPSLTRAQLDITIDYNEISKVDKTSIGKLVVASFDIECCSADGSFPKFDRKNDPVIQIGTTVYISGENVCKLKYIATLGLCEPIEEEDPNCKLIVESFRTERDVILGWASFIQKLDPDIITGFNIWGFDWEYLYKRAESGNGGQVPSYHGIFFRKLQRLINPHDSYPLLRKLESRDIDENEKKKIDLLTVQDLSSSALGVNILKFIDIEGIVQFDLYKVVQRDHKLDSYKLDNIAKHFMKQQKVDLSPKELFRNFKIGTPDKIKEIAVYCIMDCKLVNELVNKLDVITSNLGMSNVCVVPFSYLFLRGQGIKIFSLVVKFCSEENFLIKDLSDDDIDKNSYEGAIVFVPTPGVYFEPIVVMDYNSLYPSSMIAENISHDSIVGYQEYKLKPKNKETDVDNYELVKDTINTKYDNLSGYHYIDIPYDLFQGVDDDKKKIGYKVCRFAEADNGDKSVLPRILRKLLKARKDTRKIMEYYTYSLNDGTEVEGIPKEFENHYELFNVIKGTIIVNKDQIISSRKTNSDFQISILDGLQLAYKVTCNSLYGQVGAATSPICYKELAACTTATGRRMVTTARDLTLAKFVGAKLTYGDSVTGDTPLLVMKNGYIDVVSIQDFSYNWKPYEEFKPFDTNRKNKEQSLSDYLVWTNDGWAKIHRVIRHKTYKKLYRVKTNIGIVDVTEDHSLLDINKKIIKPTECVIGTELLHHFPKEFPIKKYEEVPLYEMERIINDLNVDILDKIPFEILNDNVQNKIKFIELMERYEWNNKTKIFYQSLYYLIKSVSLISKLLDYIPIKLNGNNEIIDIQYLRETKEDEYVYDIETEYGNFHGGIGQLILKNTDSIFVNFADEIRRRNPGKELTEKELLAESIKIGEEAAANINANMKAPQNIEYEKTFWPFCIFSKKRYFGNKYEHSTEKYKQTSMGIVLKRRDNAPIVKTIYGGVIDIILNKRDIEASKKFFYNSIKDLLDGKVDINQLVISKTVKTDYSNPNQIAHKVLADRMGERDPGNKPQSNDRIPYCYIDTTNLKCKICEGKVTPDTCKCITCMNIYCYHHLKNHKQQCTIMCRFCKITNDCAALTKCNTCTGWYCNRCYDKHNLRKDKYKKIHHDKCKKPLNNKLLQGDTIEHPSYITEKKLKIDYKYYLEHQIEKPVYQIFELVMKNPEKIIEDLLRKLNNLKAGNHSIKDWLMLGKKKTEEQKPVEIIDNNNNNNNITENIIKVNSVNTLNENVDENENDEDENLLKDQFEEDDVNLEEEIIEDNNGNDTYELMYE